MGTRKSLNGRENIWHEENFWHQSEARTAATVWKWSGKTLSPGTLLAVLYFSSCHIFFRPFRLFLVPTICPWVSEDGREWITLPNSAFQSKKVRTNAIVNNTALNVVIKGFHPLKEVSTKVKLFKTLNEKLPLHNIKSFLEIYKQE